MINLRYLLNDYRFYIVLIVLLFIYLKNTSIEKFTEDEFKFKSKKLLDVVNDLKKRFGEPYSSKLVEDGYLMWKKVSLFEYILIQDQSYTSVESDYTCGNITLSIKIFIPDNKMEHVLDVHNNLSYDRLKKQLVCRGDSLNNMLKIFITCVDVVNDIKNKDKYMKDLKDLLVNNEDIEVNLFKLKLKLDKYNEETSNKLNKICYNI